MGAPKHPHPSSCERDSSTASGPVWRRIVERVADAEPSHLTIHAGESGWRPFSAGVDVKVLHKEAGVMSYLLRLAPGATLSPHRHPQDEECMVLEGHLRVGTTVELGPGDYHRAHRGALHATVSTVSGATIFLRGAVPSASHLLE